MFAALANNMCPRGPAVQFLVCPMGFANARRLVRALPMHPPAPVTTPHRVVDRHRTQLCIGIQICLIISIILFTSFNALSSIVFATCTITSCIIVIIITHIFIRSINRSSFGARPFVCIQ